MSNGFFKVPKAINEPVKQYAPNSPEKKELKAMLAHLSSQVIEVPAYIGGKRVFEGKKTAIVPPHDHQHILGYYYKSTKEQVSLAIEAALEAKSAWANMPWESRAAIFLKAAELLAGPYRAKLNAATMLGQSKNCFQAEIDAACELIDFYKFNVEYATHIYSAQPDSLPGMWNRLEYRPLEGFVFALTPFNFTSIAGNLPAAPALMGNTVVWKASEKQIYSANVIMEIYKEAGLPDGVINLIYPSGPDAGDIIFSHPDFGGIHFTGSTGVFDRIWAEVGKNRSLYKSYPRLVGETGGKDFIFIHPSGKVKESAVAISRGAFEYQGQKCSAASRVYLPKSLYPEILKYVQQDMEQFEMGDVQDFRNFINAVIDEKSFDKLASYIDSAKKASDAKIVAGGNYDKSKGFFIEPTIIETSNAMYSTMCEELFGPVVTFFVYDDSDWKNTLQILNETSPYALTGAIFAQDRYAIDEMTKILRDSAGNFYINDKPTGAVVGQQPFGGARGSGTNDKAGSYLNLLRWVSPRTIKETFVPPIDFGYAFLGEE